MPVNRNALIRYRTIDKCLQNRRRKWTIENLMDACTEALFEAGGIDKDISLRTIRLDLKAMRSDQLGYNAPIIVVNKKHYTYEDPEYTITNIPLTTQDLGTLQEATQLLQQFKGFTHFAEMQEVINKLEDKIYSEQHQQYAAIDFEKNDLLIGINWLDVLHKAILNQTTLNLHYQSFKARQPQQMICYPYLLKEYRNRWFLLAMQRKNKIILTLALDRIKEVELLPKQLFLKHQQFNPHDYFSSIIGVTRSIGTAPKHIRLKANHYTAPYILTKPLHHSQQVEEKMRDGIVFSIEVIPNFELEKELLGFGDGIQVLSPESLVKRMKQITTNMYQLYVS
jgi:predicted DNA-binding transcriptional regulator YafY